jgi:DNA processing protein
LEEEELIYQLSLSMIRGVGFGVWSRLINSFGSAKKVYEDGNNVLLGLVQNKNLWAISQAILKKENIGESEKILREHSKEGVKIISFYDDRYPRKLKEISSAPCFLYVKGELDFNCLKTLSIVGSRTPSDYGKEMVKKIVREISAYEVSIVSGLAYGIDFLSHDEALKNNVITIAILAGGLDKIYPVIHKPLAESIISHGGMIISESPLGVIPESFHFPTRNRIIAGFSDATLVVEAGLKSGSNITALCANDYNREVFAVPGNVGSLLSVGCNNLIKKNQAHLTTCAEDIAEVMNWDKKEVSEKNKSTNEKVKKNIPKNLDADSKKILLELQKCDYLSIDELIDKTDIALDKLSMILLQLELLNLIKILPGNRFANI